MRTRNVVVWGWLRFGLGVCQMTLSLAALWAFVTAGLHTITLGLVASATGLALVSRLLYRGRVAPPEDER